MKTFIFALSLLFPMLVGAQTFTDDFNRPDGPVGNGWVNATDNTAGALTIMNGRLTNRVLARAGIYRPFDTTHGVTISATYTQENAEAGALNRYGGHAINIGSAGAPFYSGYGIYISRSDSRYNNSDVELQLNGAVLGAIPSTFQYGASIKVLVTFETNGRVSGIVSGDGNTFTFDFGPRAVNLEALSGRNVLIELEPPDNRTAVFTYPTVDDLAIYTSQQQVACPNAPHQLVPDNANAYGLYEATVTDVVVSTTGGPTTGVLTVAPTSLAVIPLQVHVPGFGDKPFPVAGHLVYALGALTPLNFASKSDVVWTLLPSPKYTVSFCESGTTDITISAVDRQAVAVNLANTLFYVSGLPENLAAAVAVIGTSAEIYKEVPLFKDVVDSLVTGMSSTDIAVKSAAYFRATRSLALLVDGITLGAVSQVPGISQGLNHVPAGLKPAELLAAISQANTLAGILNLTVGELLLGSVADGIKLTYLTGEMAVYILQTNFQPVVVTVRAH